MKMLKENKLLVGLSDVWHWRLRELDSRQRQSASRPDYVKAGMKSFGLTGEDAWLGTSGHWKLAYPGLPREWPQKWCVCAIVCWVI